MMFHGLGRLGDDNSAGASALATSLNLSTADTTSATGSADCQWCVNNPFLAVFSPTCWSYNTANCSGQNIASAYVAAGVPVVPPDQNVVNSQTPDQTINDMVGQAHQNAVDVATATAANEAAAQAALNNNAGTPPPTVCTQGAPIYNPFLCFMRNNSGTIFTAGLIAMGLAFVIPPAKGGRR